MEDYAIYSEKLKDIVVLECGHSFHAKYLWETYVQSKQCPTCRKHIDAEIEYECNLCVGEYSSFFKKTHAIINTKEFSYDAFEMLLRQEFPELSGAIRVIYGGREMNRGNFGMITPKFTAPNKFKIYLHISDPLVEQKIQTIQRVKECSHEIYEKVYPNRKIKEGSTKIKVILPEWKMETFSGKRPVYMPQRDAYIISTTPMGYVIQLIEPYCMGELCRNGPTLDNRFYYISNENKIYSMSDVFCVSPIQPELIDQHKDYCYRYIIATRDGTNIKIERC